MSLPSSRRSPRNSHSRIVETEIERLNQKTQEAIQQPIQQHSEHQRFFFEYMVDTHGGFDSLFRFLGLNPLVFLAIIPVVSDIYTARRGRKSFFYNPDDRLLLEVYESAKLFKVVMKDSFIIFNNENLQGTNLSAIVDCTITPTNAPSGSFSSKMSFYSGKYKTYCIKIEVVVNSVTGTACYVSEGEPGASHDTRL
ncbi:hypothetical protein EIN_150020 [Entamoeba invadens IP1]|uniref:DDE Tnp4 domain-containing protein n=1 Tax=Entamoeba invadens IP1 TaxID=370355 RepID=A0A0A1U8A4_ENTIV|nr:hypothetical protein EIN_150020 [Entamoeba invadens IP1]ELP91175.1 hypothetical protein EIN_150020 [Entamoeba invadens IP1]|eukprot:XP_004257946.1 hypothetical protein EIN_150020 [Entamoeba invadens IP1]